MPAPTPTDEQRRLIEHDPVTPARVLAGPGTGKSFTLIAFLERLLALETPPKVKLLTFTRAATAELAAKVAGHPAAGAEKPSTVHSFSISILLRNPGSGNFPEPLRIADNWEQRELVEPTLRQRAGLRDVYALRGLLSKLAANWESLTDVDFAVRPEEKARFLGAWNEHRRVYGYTMLAELPYALLQALKIHEDLKGIDFDVLLVDEYQDLNACDLALLKNLAGRGCTIVAAGDDDQSIYSGRQADPAGIRRFPEDYPGASNYPLSTTLRCGRRILEWARFIIEGDPGRDAARPPLSPAEGSPDGDVALLQFKGDVSEASGVADLVEGLINKKGLRAREILVLLRSDNNRTFSNPIRAKLEERGIECTDPNEVEDLLAENLNRRALAMLRLLVFPRDSLAWATLLKLTNGVGNKFFEYIYERALPEQKTFAEALFDAHAASYPDAPRASAKKAGALVDSVRPWTEQTTVPDKPPEEGWSSWLAELIAGGTLPRPTDRFLELFADVEAHLEDEESLSLGRLLSQLQPIGRDLAQSTSEGVRIMTMVGSKGLTVEAAILVGVEEGIVPRPDRDLNEERRILYVAMTRAKRFLYATWASRRRGPTARAGKATPNLRQFSTFFQGGPVASQSGEQFIRTRIR